MKRISRLAFYSVAVLFTLMWIIWVYADSFTWSELKMARKIISMFDEDGIGNVKVPASDIFNQGWEYICVTSESSDANFLVNNRYDLDVSSFEPTGADWTYGSLEKNIWSITLVEGDSATVFRFDTSGLNPLRSEDDYSCHCFSQSFISLTPTNESNGKYILKVESLNIEGHCNG